MILKVLIINGKLIWSSATINDFIPRINSKVPTSRNVPYAQVTPLELFSRPYLNCFKDIQFYFQINLIYRFQQPDLIYIKHHKSDKPDNPNLPHPFQKLPMHLDGISDLPVHYAYIQVFVTWQPM